MVKRKQMKTSVETCDEVVVLRFEGVLGFDEKDVETMRGIDSIVQERLNQGSTRFLVDLTKARAVYGSSVGLLFQPFLNVLRNQAVRIAVVESKLKRGHELPLVPTWGPSRLTTEELTMLRMNEVFDIFPTVEEAIGSLRSDPPETSGQE